MAGYLVQGDTRRDGHIEGVLGTILDNFHHTIRDIQSLLRNPTDLVAKDQRNRTIRNEYSDRDTSVRLFNRPDADIS